MSRATRRLEQDLERKIKANRNKALDWLARRVERDCRQFVPTNTGALVNSSVIEDHAVVYRSPYAHYMNEGILYVDPGTGSAWSRKGVQKVPTGIPLKYRNGTDHWFEAAKAVYEDEWAEGVAKVLIGGK